MPNVLNVSFNLSIGDKSFKPGPDSPLVALDVECALNVPAHICRLELRGGTDVTAEPDDPVKVELGYDDTLETVYTGRVASFRWGIERVRIEALSKFASLTTARLNRLYENQNSGDIASDLLKQLEVETAATEPGVKFATFAVGDNLPVWDHLQTLAERCDFVFHADHEDKAVFKKQAPAKTHQFTYGENLLSYDRDGLATGADGIEVYGSSPSGQGKGDEALSWVTAQEVKGTGGETKGVLHRLIDPSARNPTLAGTLAKNLMAARQRREVGRVRLIGAPEVHLGDAISFQKMPEGAHTGEARVVSVRHRLNSREGFVTTLRWEET